MYKRQSLYRRGSISAKSSSDIFVEQARFSSPLRRPALHLKRQSLMPTTVDKMAPFAVLVDTTWIPRDNIAPPWQSTSRPPSLFKKVRTKGCQKPVSQAVLSRMQLTLHATRRALGARSMSAWSVKPDVLRAGIVGMPGSMVIRLRPCLT